MSFLQRLLLQRDSTTTEKLQNGLVNEEVCKNRRNAQMNRQHFLFRCLQQRFEILRRRHEEFRHQTRL